MRAALTARLAPERNTFTKVGMVLRGAYHETIPYHYNSFGSLLVGADIGGNNATFDFNQFADCYGTALRAGGPDVYDPLDYVLLSDNTIDIPAAQNPGGQVPANAEVKGIELPRLGVQGAAIQVFHNQIGSLTRPGNVFKVKVGLDAQLFFYETDIMKSNAFSGLDHGVRLFDAAGTYPYQTVSDNTFDTFTNGITLTGTQNAPFSPTLSCNNLSNGNRGIYVAGNAQVGDLGNSSEPCGNNYDPSVSRSVQNDGTYRIAYYAQGSPMENVPFGLFGTRGGTSTFVYTGSN